MKTLMVLIKLFILLILVPSLLLVLCSYEGFNEKEYLRGKIVNIEKQIKTKYAGKNIRFPIRNFVLTNYTIQLSKDKTVMVSEEINHRYKTYDSVTVCIEKKGIFGIKYVRIATEKEHAQFIEIAV